MGCDSDFWTQKKQTDEWIAANAVLHAVRTNGRFGVLGSIHSRLFVDFSEPSELSRSHATADWSLFLPLSLACLYLFDQLMRPRSKAGINLSMRICPLVQIEVTGELHLCNRLLIFLHDPLDAADDGGNC